MIPTLFLEKFFKISGVSGGEFAFEGVADHEVIAGNTDGKGREQGDGFRHYQREDGHEAGLQTHVD